MPTRTRKSRKQESVEAEAEAAETGTGTGGEEHPCDTSTDDNDDEERPSKRRSPAETPSSSAQAPAPTATATPTTTATRGRSRGRPKKSAAAKTAASTVDAKAEEDDEAATTGAETSRAAGVPEDTEDSRFSAGADGDADGRTLPKRNDVSLLTLTRQFVTLVQSAPGGVIELNEAARKLGTQKRRIYDITNVLEGINLIEKLAKNSVRWLKPKAKSEAPAAAAPTAPEDAAATKEEEEKRKTEKEIVRVKERIEELLVEDTALATRYKEVLDGMRKIREDMELARYAYVLTSELQSMEKFHQKTAFAIRAPTGSTLEVPERGELLAKAKADGEKAKADRVNGADGEDGESGTSNGDGAGDADGAAAAIAAIREPWWCIQVTSETGPIRVFGINNVDAKQFDDTRDDPEHEDEQGYDFDHELEHEHREVPIVVQPRDDAGLASPAPAVAPVAAAAIAPAAASSSDAFAPGVGGSILMEGDDVLGMSRILENDIFSSAFILPGQTGMPLLASQYFDETLAGWSDDLT